MKKTTGLPDYLIGIILAAAVIMDCSFFLRIPALHNYPTLLLTFAVTPIAILCFVYYILNKQTLTSGFEKQKKAEIQGILQKCEQERQQLTQKIGNLEAQLKNSVKVSPANLAGDSAALAHKCTVLEEFRNSFPYKISDGYFLYNIMRTEVRVSEYSRWQIVGDFGGNLWTLFILRPDTQSYREMLQLISTTKTPEEIGSFSMHNNMLWM